MQDNIKTKERSRINMSFINEQNIPSPDEVRDESAFPSPPVRN